MRYIYTPDDLRALAKATGPQWAGEARAALAHAADVLEAADEVIKEAQQVAVPEPLSDEEIEATCRFIEPSFDGPIAYDLLIARAIEAAHGIGEKP